MQISVVLKGEWRRLSEKAVLRKHGFIGGVDRAWRDGTATIGALLAANVGGTSHTPTYFYSSWVSSNAGTGQNISPLALKAHRPGLIAHYLVKVAVLKQEKLHVQDMGLQDNS